MKPFQVDVPRLVRTILTDAGAVIAVEDDGSEWISLNWVVEYLSSLSGKKDAGDAS